MRVGARITLVASAAAAVGLAAPGILPAAAGGHGAAASSPGRMVTMRTLGQVQRSSRTARTNNMSYHGGPVETAPKVYISWWGSEWNTGFSTGGYTSAQAQTYTTDFFSNVGGTGWDNINSQYCQGVATGTVNCGSSGTHIANSLGQLAGTWNDTTTVPSSPSQSDIANAALRLAQKFGGPVANATYFVYTPSGKSMSGFATSWCAWHSLTSGNVAYAYMPYQPDAGGSCGMNFVNKTNDSYGNGYFDGFSVVGGHEYAEALTDPLPSSGKYAWTDSRGSEIGDKCAWSSLSTNLTVGSTFWAVQPLWSNANSGCVTSY